MSHLSSYLQSSRKSQATLAEEVGVSRGYMSELVAGAKKPGLDLAFAIERATDGAVPAASWVSLPEEGPAAEAVTVNSVPPTEDAA